MIQVSEVISRVAADLDAEGSDRYLFEQDYKPAINKAINWSTSVLSHVFSQSRHIADRLTDLKKTGIYELSSLSRFVLNNPTLSPEKVWTVLAVIVKPNIHPAQKTPKGFSNPAMSVYRTDVSYAGGGIPCSRATEEEYTELDDNVFMRGNALITSDSLKSYVWLEPHNYNSSEYESPNSLPEIEIKPSVSNEFVAVRYLKEPEEVSEEGDSIEFPLSMIDIISTKTLNFISRKQGNQTNLFTVTQSDVQEMISILG